VLTVGHPVTQAWLLTVFAPYLTISGYVGSDVIHARRCPYRQYDWFARLQSLRVAHLNSSGKHAILSATRVWSTSMFCCWVEFIEVQITKCLNFTVQTCLRAIVGLKVTDVTRDYVTSLTGFCV